MAVVRLRLLILLESDILSVDGILLVSPISLEQLLSLLNGLKKLFLLLKIIEKHLVVVVGLQY
jgi:hypothetical protein